MASHLTQICDRIQTLVIDELPEAFKVNYSAISDPWYLGPELERDIEGAAQDNTPFLNAIILSPRESSWEPVDEQGCAQTWEQVVDLYFLYARQTADGPKTLRSVIEKYADPLHTILTRRGLRRLGNLKLADSDGVKSGHVTEFTVAGPPDVYSEADNNALAPLGLACFRIRLLVRSVVQLDPESR